MTHNINVYDRHNKTQTCIRQKHQNKPYHTDETREIYIEKVYARLEN